MAQFDPLLDLLKQNGFLDDDAIAVIEEEKVNQPGKTSREILLDGEYSFKIGVGG